MSAFDYDETCIRYVAAKELEQICCITVPKDVLWDLQTSTNNNDIKGSSHGFGGVLSDLHTCNVLLSDTETKFDKNLPDFEIHPPEILHKICLFLSDHLHVEGLFRISGSCKRINLLKASLENGEVLSSVHPHDVANILMQFLRKLSVHLIPKCMNSIVSELTKLDTEEVLLDGLQLFCLLLPTFHLRTLIYILRFFHKVADHCRENKMNSSCLATVLAPNIMESDICNGIEDNRSLMMIQMEFVKLLIDHCHLVGDVPYCVARTSCRATKCLHNWLEGAVKSLNVTKHHHRRKSFADRLLHTVCGKHIKSTSLHKKDEKIKKRHRDTHDEICPAKRRSLQGNNDSVLPFPFSSSADEPPHINFVANAKAAYAPMKKQQRHSSGTTSCFGSNKLHHKPKQKRNSRSIQHALYEKRFAFPVEANHDTNITAGGLENISQNQSECDVKVKKHTFLRKFTYSFMSPASKKRPLNKKGIEQPHKDEVENKLNPSPCKRGYINEVICNSVEGTTPCSANSMNPDLSLFETGIFDSESIHFTESITLFDESWKSPNKIIDYISPPTLQVTHVEDTQTMKQHPVAPDQFPTIANGGISIDDNLLKTNKNDKCTGTGDSVCTSAYPETNDIAFKGFKTFHDNPRRKECTSGGRRESHEGLNDKYSQCEDQNEQEKTIMDKNSINQSHQNENFAERQFANGGNVADRNEVTIIEECKITLDEILYKLSMDMSCQSVQKNATLHEGFQDDICKRSGDGSPRVARSKVISTRNGLLLDKISCTQPKKMKQMKCRQSMKLGCPAPQQHPANDHIMQMPKCKDHTVIEKIHKTFQDHCIQQPYMPSKVVSIKCDVPSVRSNASQKIKLFEQQRKTQNKPVLKPLNIPSLTGKVSATVEHFNHLVHPSSRIEILKLCPLPCCDQLKVPPATEIPSMKKDVKLPRHLCMPVVKSTLLPVNHIATLTKHERQILRIHQDKQKINDSGLQLVNCSSSQLTNMDLKQKITTSLSLSENAFHKKHNQTNRTPLVIKNLNAGVDFLDFSPVKRATPKNPRSRMPVVPLCPEKPT